MRRARIKTSGTGTYYHLVNHVGGAKNSLPFSNTDKHWGMYLVEKLVRYYLLEVISVCWMGNHFHIVLYAPGTPPSLKIAAKRFNSHYKLNKKSEDYLTPQKDPEKCAQVATNLIDISHFMKCLQQSYSIYFNKKYNREGPLWKERFWSTVLEGITSLWDCVKYVELNSVRANITQKPEDYNYSTWGVYSKTGKHPFSDSFVLHMRSNYRGNHQDMNNLVSSKQLFALFSHHLKIVLAHEDRLTDKEMQEEIALAHKNSETFFARYLIRIHQWSRGLIVGSGQFVKKIASKVDTFAQTEKKVMSHGKNSRGIVITSYHRGNLCTET